MPQTIYILAGISSSGKSTYANELAKKTGARIISTDAIRKELTGSEENQDKNGFIFTVVVPQRITKALQNGESVIFDAMSLKARDRKAILKLVPASVRKECHYIPADATRSLKLQEGRARKVPTDIILNQASRFVTPSISEGFNLVLNCLTGLEDILS